MEGGCANRPRGVGSGAGARTGQPEAALPHSALGPLSPAHVFYGKVPIVGEMQEF